MGKPAHLPLLGRPPTPCRADAVPVLCVPFHPNGVTPCTHQSPSGTPIAHGVGPRRRPRIQPLPPWQPPLLRRPCDAGSPTGLPASPAQWPVDKITCPPPDHPCPIAHKHDPHTGSNSPTWPPRLSDLSVHPPRPAPSRGVSSHLPACMECSLSQASWRSPFLRARGGLPGRCSK